MRAREEKKSSRMFMAVQSQFQPTTFSISVSCRNAVFGYAANKYGMERTTYKHYYYLIMHNVVWCGISKVPKGPCNNFNTRNTHTFTVPNELTQCVCNLRAHARSLARTCGYVSNIFELVILIIILHTITDFSY